MQPFRNSKGEVTLSRVLVKVKRVAEFFSFNFAQSNVFHIRVRPIFFDQVGHETMYAASGNNHFFTKSCHRQT